MSQVVFVEGRGFKSPQSRKNIESTMEESQPSRGNVCRAEHSPPFSWSCCSLFLLPLSSCSCAFFLSSSSSLSLSLPLPSILLSYLLLLLLSPFAVPLPPHFLPFSPSLFNSFMYFFSLVYTAVPSHPAALALEFAAHILC